MNEEYNQVIKNGTSAGGVSELEVSQFETKIGHSFPEDFRNFLLNQGAIVGEGYDIYGFVNPAQNEPPFWGDLKKEYERIRGYLSSEIEESCVPIADNGMGVIYFMDISNGRYFAYGPGVDKVIVAESFCDFVVKHSSQAINL